MFLTVTLICLPDAADNLGGFDVSIGSGEAAPFSDWEWEAASGSEVIRDIPGDDSLPGLQPDPFLPDDAAAYSRAHSDQEEGEETIDLPREEVSTEQHQPGAPREEVSTERHQPGAPQEEVSTEQLQPAAPQEEVSTEQHQPGAPQEEVTTEQRQSGGPQTPTVTQEAVIYIIPDRMLVPTEPPSSLSVSIPDAVAFIEEEKTGKGTDYADKEAGHTDKEADHTGTGWQDHLQEPAPDGPEPSLPPDFRYEVRDCGIEIFTSCMAEILSFRVNGRETSFHWEGNLLCPDRAPEEGDIWMSAAVLLDGAQVVRIASF